MLFTRCPQCGVERRFNPVDETWRKWKCSVCGCVITLEDFYSEVIQRELKFYCPRGSCDY